MGKITDALNASYEIPNRVLESVPNPKISVRTSTYNHASFIERCIEGVLMQQTDFQFEYIIGEDFSTDGTREIVFQYAEKYPDIIRVITADRNVGIKANSYRCRKKVRGEFTALCEGDDYWIDPKKLQKQIDLLSEHPQCDLCFHPAIIKYVDKPGVDRITGKQAEGNSIIPVKKLIMNYGDFCPTASIVYKSKIDNALGEWFLSTLIGDYYFQILGADRGGALYLDEVMSVYNKSPEGAWSKISRRMKQMSKQEKCTQLLRMSRSMKKLDEAMDFRHHKWIRKRRMKSIIRFFLKFYTYDKDERESIKKSMQKYPDLAVKLEIYGLMIVSYIYHKLHGKIIIRPIIRKITNLSL